MRVQTDVHHDPIGYGLGLMVTKRAPQVDGWMDGRTDGRHLNHFTSSAVSTELKMVVQQVCFTSNISSVCHQRIYRIISDIEAIH
jgi:hypothetical protein